MIKDCLGPATSTRKLLSTSWNLSAAVNLLCFSLWLAQMTPGITFSFRTKIGESADRAPYKPIQIFFLSGESSSVSKDTAPTKTAKAVYQDKRCILFSGTVVTVGRGRAVVVAVGSNTGIGKIRGIMTESEGEMTPLKKKLDEFGTFLSKVSGLFSR